MLAREIFEKWRLEYNSERPHSSLGNLSPWEFTELWEQEHKILTSEVALLWGEERWTPITGQWLRCELLINMSPIGGHHDKEKTT
jgi:hypothetical protein